VPPLRTPPEMQAVQGPFVSVENVQDEGFTPPPPLPDGKLSRERQLLPDGTETARGGPAKTFGHQLAQLDIHILVPGWVASSSTRPVGARTANSVLAATSAVGTATISHGTTRLPPLPLFRTGALSFPRSLLSKLSLSKLLQGQKIVMPEFAACSFIPDARPCPGIYAGMECTTMFLPMLRSMHRSRRTELKA